MFDDSNLLGKAKAYCKDNGRVLLPKAKLGHGTDGAVWSTTIDSAVKALNLHSTYLREVAAYERLAEKKITKLHGLNVPELLGYDEELLVIEMTIVQPPFLLDFGKAYVDRQPPYWDDAQLVANAHEEWASLFDDRWPDVVALLGALESLGIYYVDPRPGNIVF